MLCTMTCLYSRPLNSPRRQPFRNYSSPVTPPTRRWKPSKNLCRHMSDKQTILQSILSQGMLPLFYWDSPTVSLEVIRTLYKAGIRALEYTNRGPAALENFRFLKKELSDKTAPGLYLGIGTIKTTEEAEAFIKAGADFIVSPIVNGEVARAAEKA